MSNTTMTLKMAKRGLLTIPKRLRDSYGMKSGDIFTLLDLGEGIFILSPKRSEIDAIADKIANQWTEDGETLDSMLEALREERDQRGG